jgi:hypothetical protein
VDWPGAWDQQAWSLTLTALGLGVGVASLIVVAFTFRRAGEAKTAAQNAVNAVAQQSVVGNVGRLEVLAEQLGFAMFYGERALALVALGNWCGVVNETIVLLQAEAENTEGDGDGAARLREELGLSREMAELAREQLHNNPNDPVADSAREANRQIMKTVSTGQQYVALKKMRLPQEAD